MVCTASPRSATAASNAASAPAARATSSREISGTICGSPRMPQSTTVTSSPAALSRSRTKPYSAPLVSMVPTRTTLAMGILPCRSSATARWRRSILEGRPDRGVVGGVLLPTHLAVDVSIDQPPRHFLRKQDVIEPQAAVPLPALAHVVPEGEDLLLGMLLAERIHPALIEEPRILLARRRLHQRVVVVRARLVDVEGRGDDVVVARQDHRQARGEEV